MRLLDNRTNYSQKIRIFARLALCLYLASTLQLASLGKESVPESNSGNNENTSNSQNNSQIDDIIEKSIQAYGNKECLANFANNMQFIGSITSQNDSATKHSYKYTRKAPAWRTDIEDQPSTIYDGTNLSQFSNSQSKNLSPEQAQWQIDQVEHEPFLLSYWRNPAYQFQLLGETNYKHIPVYAVEITSKDKTPTIIYLDRSNYLVCAIAFQSWRIADNSDELKKVTVIKEFSENRPILNSIWPFKETILVDKKPLSVIELSTIAEAGAVNPDYFRPAFISSPENNTEQKRLSSSIIVPFEYCQSEIVCRGKIENIEPLWFLIDTGTSDTIIDRSVAAHCLLPQNGDFRFSSFRGSMPAQTTTLDRLELGDLIINNVHAQIADLSQQSKQVGRSIAGIIGMNVLANYLVTIDYAKPSLLFADPYKGSRPSDLVSISFASASIMNAPLAHTSLPPRYPRSDADGSSLTDSSGNSLGSQSSYAPPPIPRIRITLPGGDTETMLIDTGAAFNHLPIAIATKHLKDDVSKTSHSHTIEGTGLDGRPVRLGLITLDPIIVGSYKIHRITFTYPANQSESAGHNNDVLTNTLAVSGILGNPFFEHFLVTLDCPFQRILLKANPQFETSFQLEEALNLGDTALFTKRDFRQAEFAYQKVWSLAENSHNVLFEALAQGRLGNLRRMMSHDLHRPEHAQAAYQYFKKADRLANENNLKEAQGRILADWSLLYSENGQTTEAKQTIEKALSFAPKDPYVNVDYAVHLFREHAYAEAEKYIGKALFFDPTNWQALWYQLKLSEMFNDLAKEKSTLQEILQHYPWSKLAQSKLKALEPAPTLVPFKKNVAPTSQL